MSLRRQIIANLRHRLEEMPEIDGGDVLAVRIVVYTDGRTLRRLDRLVISAERQFDRAPAGVEVQADLET